MVCYISFVFFIYLSYQLSSLWSSASCAIFKVFSFINLDESKFFLSLKYYVGLRTKVIGVEHSFNHIQKVINTIIANQIQLLDKVFHRIYEVRYIFFVWWQSNPLSFKYREKCFFIRLFLQLTLKNDMHCNVG